MSRAATEWAWSLKLKATQKLLALALADRADEKHCCYPSIQRLASDTGLDKKTIGKCINQMIADGLISDTGDRKGHTKQVRVFQLNLDAEQAQKRNSPKNVTIPKTEQSQICTRNDPKFGHETDPNLDMKRSQIRDTESVIESVIEPVIESTPKPTPCVEGLIRDAVPVPDKPVPDNVRTITGRYAFEGQVVRLNHQDYEQWRTLYPNIDLQRELQRMDLEFSHDGQKHWFSVASAKLNYQNNKHAPRSADNRSMATNFSAKNYGETQIPSWMEG